jgi:hypothetical protein
MAALYRRDGGYFRSHDHLDGMLAQEGGDFLVHALIASAVPTPAPLFPFPTDGFQS